MKKRPAPNDGALFITNARAHGTRPLRLGIMGGTFNPIHYGHLMCAEQARSKFHLDQVIFVPSGLPPHKETRHVASSEHRYLMTVLAVSTNPFFSVSRTEIDRKGPSYAIDTIRHFIETDEKNPPRIFFITGCDAVMEILSWRSPDELMRLATVIAASRPGYDFNGLKNTVGPARFKRIRLVEVSALAISSTDIRNRVLSGQPIKYLLPESVEHHIRKHGLYSEES